MANKPEENRKALGCGVWHRVWSVGPVASTAVEACGVALVGTREEERMG